MHIPDGILPAEVAIAGYAAAGALTWVALRQINREDDPEAGVPKAALLTSAFFVASWIHIPVPPTSVHLVLNGLLGVVLGYYAIPAILIGLFFQAVMFGHGGLTTLGVNATIMGTPALLAYHLFELRHTLRLTGRRWTGTFAFISGAGGLLLSALIAMALLITTIPSELNVAAEREAIITLTLAHIPLSLIEGAFAAALVLYLLRVKPDLLRHYAPMD
ncbi:MAG: cobalt transporter CbiM [Anaerolineae bacterium]|nr:cobalt transporter CbiM [Anaerolineae bacterium]